jgi:hypothetical protein
LEPSNHYARMKLAQLQFIPRFHPDRAAGQGVGMRFPCRIQPPRSRP